MHIDLHEWRITDTAEAVDLPGLDHKNITRSGLELLSIDGPETAPLSHELDLIVGVTMRARTPTLESMKKEDRDVDVALVRSDELMRAAHKGQVLLANAMHLRGSR
jgi:hypothetical protein